MDSGPIIQLENVTKVYHQGKIDVTAIDDFSLTVQRGDFAALCGPSGSGKTTILNIIGALDVPTAGRVTLEGNDLSRLNRTTLSAMRRDRIGFVFQAYNLIPVLTAYENAEFVLVLQGMPESRRRARVMEMLKEVGLEGLENRRPEELSGGQQQRVAIARAMVTEPAVILADEPTANLDSATAAALLTIMEHLNTVHGITFLFSTHDQRVMDRARRIITMRDGKLAGDEWKE